MFLKICDWVNVVSLNKHWKMTYWKGYVLVSYKNIKKKETKIASKEGINSLSNRSNKILHNRRDLLNILLKKGRCHRKYILENKCFHFVILERKTFSDKYLSLNSSVKNQHPIFYLQTNLNYFSVRTSKKIKINKRNDKILGQF